MHDRNNNYTKSSYIHTSLYYAVITYCFEIRILQNAGLRMFEHKNTIANDLKTRTIINLRISLRMRPLTTARFNEHKTQRLNNCKQL